MTSRPAHESDSDESIVEANGTGWLLPMPGNLLAAVGEAEMIYVFPFEPEIFAIPNTPPYARGVIVWRKRLVPLIDLSVYLQPDEAVKTQKKTISVSSQDDATANESGIGESAIEAFVALFAFQTPLEPDRTAGFGALFLSDVPERVVVSDDRACELPDDLSAWRTTALSCFSHEEYGPVPILDLTALFADSASAASSDNENTTQALVQDTR